MITDSLLVEKWETLEVGLKKVGLQKLIKFRLSGYCSFWHFSNSLKLKNHLRRVSTFHFLIHFKYLFKKVLKFLILYFAISLCHQV